MQVIKDDLGQLWIHAGDFLQVGGGGGAHFADGAEVELQRLAAARADAGDVVQNRARRLLVANLRLVGIRETVRLVADSLHKVQRLRRSRQDHGVRLVGQEQVLELLRQSRNWYYDACLLDGGHGRRDLAPPAVHDQ